MSKEPKTNEDIDKAIHLFTEAICSASSSIQSSDKGAAKFHAARGQALMQLGNFLKASHDFSTAIRLDEQNASYYASKGNCKLQLDLVSEALVEFHRAIGLAPNDGNYLLNRALVFAKLDKF